METPLTGTVALVTGGSRGIGQACARQLGELGATVLITGTSVESVDSGVRALKDCGLADANGYVVDVRDQGDVSVGGIGEIPQPRRGKKRLHFSGPTKRRRSDLLQNRIAQRKPGRLAAR